MNKNILAVSAGIILLIGLVGFAVGRVTVPTPAPTVSQPYGAVASPDIQSPYITVGGVRTWHARTDSLTQASTTVCSLQGPAATSTLIRATLTETVSSTTASLIDIGQSANPTATTTVLATVAVAASGQTSIVVASSTVFAPNMYLVVNQKAAAGLIANPTGVCQAVWQQMSY